MISSISRAGVGDVVLTQPSAKSPIGAGSPTAGMDFATVLTDVSSSAVQSLVNAESVSVSALQGKASGRDVVNAVMTAEQSLQTVIALRDKTVAALQEITRMSV